MMLYLNTKDIETLGVSWVETIDVIEQAVRTMHTNDFAQPIKPYLFYRDMRNRIIAMPAFIGNSIDMAGIKWIASFPGNRLHGLPRAHSVTILNESDTGRPLAIFNTSLVSSLRTASVSGLVIREFDKVRPFQDSTVGIVGFGPIGQCHLDMVEQVIGDRVKKVILYDIAGIKMEQVPKNMRERTVIAHSWEEAYLEADLFITCTVSSKGYIDKPPKPNALLLNVSLRDFTPNMLDYTRSIIVDDWDEVCRENTDIEWMHLERGLQKEDTYSLVDVVCNQAIRKFPTEEAVMFHPMGMAVFDIATAVYYFRLAQSRGVGTYLPD